MTGCLLPAPQMFLPAAGCLLRVTLQWLRVSCSMLQDERERFGGNLALLLAAAGRFTPTAARAVTTRRTAAKGAIFWWDSCECLALLPYDGPFFHASLTRMGLGCILSLRLRW